MSATVEKASGIRVFLIDDHRSILWGLEKLIDSNKRKLTQYAEQIGKFRP